MRGVRAGLALTAVAAGGMALLAALRPRLVSRCRSLTVRAASASLPPGARVPPPQPPPAVPAAPVRVALCQLAVSADKAANIAAASAAVREAGQQGAQLVVLPEMWNCPYGAPC